MSTTTRSVLGFDIGGTQLKVASLALDRVAWTRVVPTGRDASGTDVTEAIVAVVEGLPAVERRGIDAVGLSIPGMVRTTFGSVDLPGKLAGLGGRAIVSDLESALHLPVRCLNDGSAAALGEARLGAGRRVDRLVTLTLGTGVGSGIVIDGHIWPAGDERNGAGFGHMTLDLSGRHCLCGNRGCAETILSDVAVGSELLDHRRRGVPSPFIQDLPADGSAGFRELVTGVRRRDAVCIAIFERWLVAFSALLVSIVHAIDPKMIVIGGGMAADASLFLPRTSRYLTLHAWRYPRAAQPRIRQARLGEAAGAVGAALFSVDASS